MSYITVLCVQGILTLSLLILMPSLYSRSNLKNFYIYLYACELVHVLLCIVHAHNLAIVLCMYMYVHVTCYSIKNVCYMYMYIQYPSDARYKTNAFHIRSVHVWVHVYTHFTPGAHAFGSTCTRISHPGHMRLGLCVHTFHAQAAHVWVFVHTHLISRHFGLMHTHVLGLCTHRALEQSRPGTYMAIKQGKDIHPGQLSLFSKKKLPWVGFEPTTLCVLGERSTS